MYKKFIVWLITAIIPICAFSLDFEQRHKSIEELFFAGVNFFQQGRYQESVLAFKSFFEHGQKLSLSETDRELDLKAREEFKAFELYQETANLYPLALWHCGLKEDSLKSFKSFYSKELLNSQGLKNYALVALKLKNYKLALEVATEASSWYVAALAAFSLENWNTAEEFFQKALSESEGTSLVEQDFYLHYYLGLAQFRQGHWKQSFATLDSLYARYPNHPLSGVAAQVAIHCALQLYHQEGSQVWWDKGVHLAEKLVDSTGRQQVGEAGGYDAQQSHLEAVLLAAGLYRDGGQNQRALDLLKPYLGRRDEKVLACIILAAEIYTSEKNFQEALKLYKHIEEVASKEGDFAHTAAYRQGEILYSLEDYTAAAQAFAHYRHTYPSGTYRDAALYFNGEALWKGGLLDQAILYHEALVQQFPSSSFVFNSKISLVDLYKEKGEYQQALNHGKSLLSSYREEARAAGLEAKVAELALLEQGMEAEKAALLSRYQMVGGATTGEGRRLGVELAKLYLESSGKEELAESLLVEIFSTLGINFSDKTPGGNSSSTSVILESGGGNLDGKGESTQNLIQELGQLDSLIPRGEEATAAQGFFLLAHVCRQKEGYQEAAQLFLYSAQFYLRAGHSKSFQDSAAAALYRGAESFDVAGMKGDSRSVAQQLASLFPNSTWTQAAKIFL